ncbi:Cell division protein ZapB [Serratia fonticola]|uniref:Cell division protein ZapB n=1 Tax=Serratia fonticola TaxID=47917 RepID=A0A4U9TR80_SERFO|nr:Cell division protein ZapB [Serratia fonticola]
MSFEVFEKLEAKVQQAIDTITLLQMEIEELKEKKQFPVSGSSERCG